MANEFIARKGLIVEGTAEVQGNITVTGTVDGRDLATDGTKLDAIDTGATNDQTAAEILTALLTVDGTGSSLDADLLDGLQGSAYATAAQGTLADSALQDLVDDTTPTLGGSLDVGTNSIVSLANNNISITPDGTGDVILDGLKWPQADGTANYVIETDGAGQLSWVVNSGGSVSMSGLTDVTITSLSTGEILKWNGSAWVNQTLAETGIAAASHTHTESDITDLGTYLTDITGEALSTLSDVTITTIASGELLKWNGSAWINNTIAEAGLATSAQGALADSALQNITAEALSTLSDVTITTIASGEVLKWNGSAWINNTLTEAGIAAASHTHTESEITDLQSYLLDITAEALSTLSDVTITSIASGELLKWNGSAWVNNTLSEAGIQAFSSVLDATTASFLIADETKLDAIEALADVTDATNVAAAGAVMDSDVSEAEGFLRKTGAGAYEAIKTNIGATVDPTVNEDSGDGYAVGSVWINTTDDIIWQAADVTVGAAVWKSLSGASAGLNNVVEDTTPQLGGSLDVNGNSIVSASAGDISITPNTTGSVILDGLSWPQADGSANQIIETDGSGNLSFVTPSSGSGSITKYSQTFDATTDWGTAAGGLYTITVTAATHGGGTEPLIHIFENVSGAFEVIDPDTISVASNGDVSFKVQETPDNRFAGKVLITSSTAKYSQTFDATTDWGTAAGGLYTIVITGATHANGTSPVTQMFSGTTTFESVEVDTISVASNGDVSIKVQETPDNRFAGKALII